MKKEVFFFNATDGEEIKYHRWLPTATPRAVLQIVHGMAEYAARYDDFAQFLNNNGYAVYADDHRGHGLTAGSSERTGHFADRSGWELVVGDSLQLHQIIKQNHPDIPIFLLGHSMGSFIARDMVSHTEADYKGLILSGTSWNPNAIVVAGKIIAKMQKLFSGKKHKSKLLVNMSFGSFNNKFKPNRTHFDWLSRMPEMVDKYVKDPFCGFYCSAGFFDDMFSGILKIQKNITIQKTPSTLPVLLACGENDPVGHYTKSVKQVYQKFRDRNIKDIELKIYLQARHEILNETNRREVYDDFLRWMDFRI